MRSDSSLLKNVKEGASDAAAAGSLSILVLSLGKTLNVVRRVTWLNDLTLTLLRKVLGFWKGTLTWTHINDSFLGIWNGILTWVHHSVNESFWVFRRRGLSEHIIESFWVFWRGILPEHVNESVWVYGRGILPEYMLTKVSGYLEGKSYLSTCYREFLGIWKGSLIWAHVNESFHAYGRGILPEHMLTKVSMHMEGESYLSTC